MARSVTSGKVVSKRSKGKLYTYFVRGDDWLRLPCGPDDPDIERTIEKLLARDASILSIAELCLAYEQSDAFTALRATTQKQWRFWLRRIDADLGSLRVKSFEDASSIEVIELWQHQYSNSPRSMDYAKQVLSCLLSYAVKRRLIKVHHCSAVKSKYRVDRSHITWSDEEVATLLSGLPAHIGNAMALALLTGLRRGDLLSLQWSQVKQDHIEVWTEKSGGTTLVEIPLYGELREFIMKSNRREGHVLLNSRGKPWTADGFGSSWRKAKLALLMGWSRRHFEKILSRYVSRKNQYASLKSKMQTGMEGKVLPYLIDG
jgi:integrase